jgi:replicative DNA helicase
MIFPALPGMLYQLPENIEAEQALLGTLLAMRAEPISDLLKPEHFSDPLHTAIYEAILGRWDAWQTIDLDAIASAVALTGLLDEAGGTQYLTQLVIQSGALSAEEHARSIVLAWISRRKLDEAHKRSAEGEGRP